MGCCQFPLPEIICCRQHFFGLIKLLFVLLLALQTHNVQLRFQQLLLQGAFLSYFFLTFLMFFYASMKLIFFLDISISARNRREPWGVDGSFVWFLRRLFLVANPLIAIALQVYEGLLMGTMARGGGSSTVRRRRKLILKDLLDLIVLRMRQNTAVPL